MRWCWDCQKADQLLIKPPVAIYEIVYETSQLQNCTETDKVILKNTYWKQLKTMLKGWKYMSTVVKYISKN